MELDMWPGAVLHWGRGALAMPSDSLVAPQIQKLANCSDVISEVPKCSKIQIFRGSAPDPDGKLTSLPGPLTDGRGLAAPAKNPTPALGPSGLFSTGL